MRVQLEVDQEVLACFPSSSGVCHEERMQSPAIALLRGRACHRLCCGSARCGDTGPVRVLRILHIFRDSRERALREDSEGWYP